MNITRTGISDVLLITPEVYADDRGFFMETFNRQDWTTQMGSAPVFVQDNHSHSRRGVVRGLHYQIWQPQGKLVQVIQGEIFDVAVDLRQRSATFGKYIGVRLGGANKQSLYVPRGFAHGFMVLSETADVIYKVTDHRVTDYECCIRWDDPTLAIQWPLAGITPILSSKDQQGLTFVKAPVWNGPVV